MTRGFYRGGRGFWGRGFGYGYGLWWAWRYPWFASFFPYSLWYPWAAWVPYYTVPEAVALSYTNAGVPIPASAYVVNTAAFGDVQLPQLPSFAEVGISLDAVEQYDNTQSLNPDQQAQAAQVKDAIAAELTELRKDYADLEAQGYHVVPDMDREQFSWVKEDTSRQ